MSEDVCTKVCVSDWGEAALARLRAAVARGDGAAGLAALEGRPLEPVLQYAGDVLVAARGLPGADALAGACADALRCRGRPGDAELADEIEGRSELSPLPVDLGAVAAAMDDGLQVLDLERGDVLPAGEVEGLPIPPAALPEGEDARRGAARGWLAGQGYRAVPRRL